MLSRRFLFIAVAVLLSACAQSPQQHPAGTVRVAPDLLLTLPSPSSLGRSLEASQLVTSHYGDQTFVFEGHISITPDRFFLLGVDPMGRRALSITWTDQGIRSEAAPWLPQQVRPENILADMVLIYWPDDVVRQALGPQGAAVSGAAGRRSILWQGQEVLRADYANDTPWAGRLTYRNLAWGYWLDVQSVEAVP